MTGRVLAAAAIVAGLLAVGLVVRSAPPDEAPAMKANQTSPLRIYGAKVATLAGKPFVINLWATWCRPAVKHHSVALGDKCAIRTQISACRWTTRRMQSRLPERQVNYPCWSGLAGMSFCSAMRATAQSSLFRPTAPWSGLCRRQKDRGLGAPIEGLLK